MTKLMSVANTKGEVVLYRERDDKFIIIQSLKDCSSVSYSYQTHLEVSLAFTEARERLMSE